MLKVYYDESYNQGVYVIAGYLTDARNWEKAFEPRWRSMLREKPSIPCIHLQELMTPPSASAFGKLSFKQRDNRIRQAIQIIKDCDLIPISLILDQEAIEGEKKSSATKKYFTSVWLAMSIRGVLLERHRAGLRDKLSICFDRLASETEEIRVSKLYNAFFLGCGQDERHVLPPQLVFGDKYDKIALQVADLLAWYTRYGAVANGAKNELADIALDGVTPTSCTSRDADRFNKGLALVGAYLKVHGLPQTQEQLNRMATRLNELSKLP